MLTITPNIISRQSQLKKQNNLNPISFKAKPVQGQKIIDFVNGRLELVEKRGVRGQKYNDMPTFFEQIVEGLKKMGIKLQKEQYNTNDKNGSSINVSDVFFVNPKTESDIGHLMLESSYMNRDNRFMRVTLELNEPPFARTLSYNQGNASHKAFIELSKPVNGDEKPNCTLLPFRRRSE